MEAGLDIASACQNMSRFYSAKAYQKSVSDAVKAVNAGESISVVLQRVSLLFTHGMKQMVLSAEKSGEWARSVEIVRAGYEEDVERFYDSLTEWLPRFFYLLVIGVGFSVLM